MNDNNGWIKLHRKVLDNPVVMKDSDHFAVWVYLLLNASHAEYPALFKGEKIMLQPGQLITGRKSIASNLNMNESKIRRILDLFENDHQIDRQRTNKNSLISILNWDKYQISDQQDDQQMTNKRPTSGQQVTTNKKIKNVKEDKEDKERISYQQIADMYNSLCPSFPSVKSLSDARKKTIKARLNNYSIDDFKTLFEKAEASSFLKGGNDRNWVASFDWLIKDSNMAKVLDGNYDNRPGKGKKEIVPAWMDKPKKPGFNDMIHTDYDFDAIEKKMNSDLEDRVKAIKERIGVE